LAALSGVFDELDNGSASSCGSHFFFFFPYFFFFEPLPYRLGRGVQKWDSSIAIATLTWTYSGMGIKYMTVQLRYASHQYHPHPFLPIFF
jgi:hypothetical protein